MNAVELWLLEKVLTEAGDPKVKAWVLAQLKAADVASTNQIVKVVIEAVESFLASQPS